jgi:hypothetical protein
VVEAIRTSRSSLTSISRNDTSKALNRVARSRATTSIDSTGGALSAAASTSPGRTTSPFTAASE